MGMARQVDCSFFETSFIGPAPENPDRPVIPERPEASPSPSPSLPNTQPGEGDSLTNLSEP